LNSDISRQSAPLINLTPVRIGVFDSGVGGLSVLRAIRRALPHADLDYVADGAHAPYGDRDEAYVRDRAERIADFLLAQGAQLLVVACNTATAAAAASLRARLANVPLVGVEPGIKPALASSAARRVGVLATTRTLASEKFRRLAEAHAGDGQLVLQPCPGLADAIEAADADDRALVACIERHAAPLRAAQVDTVVLGCTHYVFASRYLAEALPGATLVDTAEAVARQTARLAATLQPAANDTAGNGPATSPAAEGRLTLWTTGDATPLKRFTARWWPEVSDIRTLAV
jgi:glutamate racemase